jgi:hypothetical protein
VGQVNLELYRSVVDQFASRWTMSELLNLSVHEAPSTLRSLPRDSLVLRLNNLLDAHGGFHVHHREHAASFRRVAGSGPFVVGFRPGPGALGGVLVSGLEQGHKAGELAALILGGRQSGPSSGNHGEPQHSHV